MDKSANPRRVYRSKAQINEFVAAFEESGQTQQQFCIEHGLRPATFSTWLRKRRARQAPEGFRELRLGFGGSGALTVRLPDGIEVEFPHPAKTAEVASLILRLRRGAGGC
jgi:hypothetical protein